MSFRLHWGFSSLFCLQCMTETVCMHMPMLCMFRYQLCMRDFMVGLFLSDAFICRYLPICTNLSVLCLSDETCELEVIIELFCYCPWCCYSDILKLKACLMTNFSKAFDMVNHIVLVEKLLCWVILLICSVGLFYLTGRVQYCKVYDVLSKPRNINLSVMAHLFMLSWNVISNLSLGRIYW